MSINQSVYVCGSICGNMYNKPTLGRVADWAEIVSAGVGALALGVSHSTFYRADVEYIVAPNEGISVFVLELSIDVFLGLFQRNVHIAIETRQHSSIVHTIVKLDHDGSADELFEKITR